MGTNKKKKVAVKETRTNIEELVANADCCILVSATQGVVQITGIKNINYAFQAKGLLVSAQDTYTSRPILNALAKLATTDSVTATKVVGKKAKKGK